MNIRDAFSRLFCSASVAARIAMLSVALLQSAAHAQDLSGKISCHAETAQSQDVPHKNKFWKGYDLRVEPTQDSHGDGDECTASIVNEKGQIVF